MKKIVSDWKRGFPLGLFMLVWMELFIPSIRAGKSIDIGFLPIAFILWVGFGSWFLGWGIAFTKAKK